jgi:hypothetical protein
MRRVILRITPDKEETRNFCNSRTGIGEEWMRVAEVGALHPDAEGEVVKGRHLHVVLQELKCRGTDGRDCEVR